jgi:hypothetical protein
VINCGLLEDAPRRRREFGSAVDGSVRIREGSVKFSKRYRPPPVHPGYTPPPTRAYQPGDRLPDISGPPLVRLAAQIFVFMCAAGTLVLWSVIISANGFGLAVDEAGLMFLVLVVCGGLALTAREMRRGRQWARRVCDVASVTITLYCLIAAFTVYQAGGRVLSLVVAAASATVVLLLFVDSRRGGGYP